VNISAYFRSAMYFLFCFNFFEHWIKLWHRPRW